MSTARGPFDLLEQLFVIGVVMNRVDIGGVHDQQRSFRVRVKKSRVSSCSWPSRAASTMRSLLRFALPIAKYLGALIHQGSSRFAHVHQWAILTQGDKAAWGVQVGKAPSPGDKAYGPRRIAAHTAQFWIMRPELRGPPLDWLDRTMRILSIG